MERRIDARRRTRLRPGKLFGADGRFLADAAILDVSGSGIRLKTFRALPETGGLIVLDEREAMRWQARRVWTRDGLAGFRIEGQLARPRFREMMDLAGPYYATR